MDGCCLIDVIAYIADDVEAHAWSGLNVFFAQTTCKMTIVSVKLAQIEQIDSSGNLLGRKISISL